MSFRNLVTKDFNVPLFLYVCMSAIWIGYKVRDELRKYVLDDIGISSKKMETEVARRAILYVIRFGSEAFKKSWNDGLLETE